MKLMYNTCVPIVTNTCEVTTYYGKEMESLHVAVNDAIRQIFSRVLRDSMNHYVGRLVGQLVGRLVCPSVGRSSLAFFGVFWRFLHYCS